MRLEKSGERSELPYLDTIEITHHFENAKKPLPLQGKTAFRMYRDFAKIRTKGERKNRWQNDNRKRKSPIRIAVR